MSAPVKGSVFFDGFSETPRLSHPEGIAIHPDGSVWCGSESGDIFRISPDGKNSRVVANIGGFVLGLALGSESTLYACNQETGTICAVNLETGKVTGFARPEQEGFLPNFPLVDAARHRLLVTDSQRQPSSHPAIWEISLRTREARPWCTHPLDFPNGLALARDGRSVFVAATWEEAIYRIPISASGEAGEPVRIASHLGRLPDGLALTVDGRIVVGCYEPSEVLIVEPDGEVVSLFHDTTAHLMCHPTNIAFRGGELFTTNFGRWHVTSLSTDLAGPANSLPGQLVDTDV